MCHFRTPQRQSFNFQKSSTNASSEANNAASTRNNPAEDELPPQVRLVVDAVKERNRAKALHILRHLSHTNELSPKTLQINRDFGLIIKGKKIKKSNLAEILDYILKVGENDNDHGMDSVSRIVGAERFLKLLAHSGISSTLFKNPSIVHFIQNNR